MQAKKTMKSRSESSSSGPRNEGSSTRSRGKIRVPRCFFCLDGSKPHYLNTPLGRYLTEKGKIVPQTRTGLCHTHQRLATNEIKKARYMALLPFTTAIR